MLFSASLVVLVARSLDNQAAARLEPQLAQIVEELRAIRTQGGVSLSSGAAAPEAIEDGLVVYYFHGNVRCPTCRAIESQAHEIVQNDFAAQLDEGQVAWKARNYDKPEGADLARRFDVHMTNPSSPTVGVISRFLRGGRSKVFTTFRFQ
ncbi:MAG: nitrophenyl compound nitroreductase subunit ArsF family protein, partial [Thermoguttaceae bacterium]